MIRMQFSLVAASFLFIAFTTAMAEMPEVAFPVESDLRAGVAKVDITPSVEGGFEVAGHRRVVTGVRDPIRAAVLILDDGGTRAAIVTLDLLGAFDELVWRLRDAISSNSEVPPDHIVVAAAHNHSGPGYDPESAWGREAVRRIAAAAEEASSNMRPVSIGYGEDTISFNINRRKVINGRAVVRLNDEGPCDHRVKVLRFDDGTSLTPMAIVMHAVCHPCFFTWGDNGSPPYPRGYPKMSADFPGEAQRFVERYYDGGTSTLFLQGCAGDIRPNLPGYPYRCADEADIQWAGADLGGAVVRAAARGVIREELAKREKHYRLRVARSRIDLPGKQGSVPAELTAMKVGPFLLLTMPGEPMVEYGFKIEQAIADRAIPVVIGYANGNIGYIPTAAAYAVGGYEPNQSPLTEEAEEIILRELSRLADQVVGDVFESFSKHPRDTAKRDEASAKP